MSVNIEDAIVKAFEEMLEVIKEYREYEHDGDPWTEDARAMGEMSLDELSSDDIVRFDSILSYLKSGVA